MTQIPNIIIHHLIDNIIVSETDRHPKVDLDALLTHQSWLINPAVIQGQNFINSEIHKTILMLLKRLNTRVCC